MKGTKNRMNFEDLDCRRGKQANRSDSDGKLVEKKSNEEAYYKNKTSIL